MKQTVLIADDDAYLRDLYRRFPTRHGYDVETARGGMDCVKKVRRLEPAVLVLDQEVQRGGIDGVLARLLDESLMPMVPVILLATAEFPQDFAVFFDPPVVDVLPKPFALVARLEKVRAAVAQPGRRVPLSRNRV